MIRESFLDTPHQAEHTGCTSANLVINDEQCIEDHSKVIQSILDKSKEVEDALLEEYVGRPDD